MITKQPHPDALIAVRARASLFRVVDHESLPAAMVTLALAAAAFNATAPASRAVDMPGAPAMLAGADAAPRLFLAEHRPSRIRIGKCAEEENIHFTNLLEI